ncbi:MAG: cupin domain-containing protein [Bacillota bacterium]
MFFKTAQAKAVEMSPGMFRRTLGWGEAMMAARFSYVIGTGAPPHTHPHEQFTYVLSGRCRVRIGDEEQVVAAGEGYLVPGGATHSQEALEPTETVELWSPPRPEFR